MKILLCSLPAATQRWTDLPALLQSTDLSLNDMPLMLDFFSDRQYNNHWEGRFQNVGIKCLRLVSLLVLPKLQIFPLLLHIDKPLFLRSGYKIELEFVDLVNQFDRDLIFVVGDKEFWELVHLLMEQLNDICRDVVC